MGRTLLTRDEVKAIVHGALKRVGKPVPDVETHTFQGWTSHHRRVFVIAVTDGMQKTGHEILLTEDKLEGFASVGVFIDYVTEQQALKRSKLDPAI
jgi:hypothetical protein